MHISICLYRNLLRMAIPVFVNADNVVEYFWRITFQWEKYHYKGAVVFVSR